MRIFLILVFMILFFAPQAFAIEDPSRVTNNRFGIHIISPISQEIADSVDLVNSQGGDWGYVTVVIEDHDWDKNKWQNFFDLLRREHLIPILRLATHPVGDNWARPDESLAGKYADFLDELNWPIKNRYVVIYNEPNQAHEWGGNVDPVGYAKILDQTIVALKQKNPDFFVMNAGLDASSPQQAPNYFEEANFLQIMQESVPGIFAKLDGWVSHSYPNPGFIGSPDGYGKGSVRTWEWELSKLAQIGMIKKLPVFITETGWKHAEGVNYNKYYPSTEQVAKYYEQAFQGAWNSDRIIAITPFILNYQQSPFDHFSFKKITDEKQDTYPQYLAIKNLSKSVGQPVQLNQAKLTKGEVYSSIVAGQSYKIYLTFRNTGQSIWDDKIKLKTIEGGASLGIIDQPLEAKSSIEPGKEYVFALELKSPQTGKYHIRLNLFKENREFDNPTIEFDTEVKSPVIFQIRSALRWKNDASGDYLVSIVGPVNENLNIKLDKSGVSSEIEAKSLLPDYLYRFTLKRDYYHEQTITQSLRSGMNVINLGTLQPNFLSALLHPKAFWQLLP